MSAVLKEPDCRFRPATECDLDRIAGIEQRAYPFPWSRSLLKECLLNNYYFCTMVMEEEIMGYGIMSCVLDEAHILNLCIDPDQQSHGYGKLLLFHLIQAAGKHRARTVFLEVRFSNAVAQQLYESNGFNQLGHRKDYYPNGHGREDAIIYARDISDG